MFSMRKKIHSTKDLLQNMYLKWKYILKTYIFIKIHSKILLECIKIDLICANIINTKIIFFLNDQILRTLTNVSQLCIND